MLFDPKNIELKHLDGTIGKSDFKTDGIVTNYMGFVMGKSVPSLISGCGGGVLCLVAGRGFRERQSWALPLALVVAIGVGGFFAKGLSNPDPKKHGRAVGMTALSALTIIGLLATGTRRD